MEVTAQSNFGISESLKRLGINELNHGSSTGSESSGGGEKINSYSPVDGALIGSVTSTTQEEYEAIIKTAQAAFSTWREMPAPLRGEIVRQFGNKLREKKDDLGKLVSYEMGKSYQEGLGEYQGAEKAKTDHRFDRPPTRTALGSQRGGRYTDR